MAEYLLEFVKGIAAFTIIAQAILHFRPNKSYEKYLKLLIGMITLAIFVVPVTELFRKDSMREYELLLEGYERNIDRMYETSDFQMDLEAETYLYTLQEEMKNRLQEIAAPYGYAVKEVNFTGLAVGDAKTGEGAEGQEEGRIAIVLSGEKAGISTIQIDKVKIGGSQSEPVAGEVSQRLNADIPLLLQKFAQNLGVSKDVIDIVWRP